MSRTQRQQHIDKLMTTEVEPVEAQQEDGAQPKPTNAACHLSVSFEDSGLSRLVHAASWLKASQLVQKQNSIYPAPRHPPARSILCRKHKWRTLQAKLCSHEAYWWSCL